MAMVRVCYFASLREQKGVAQECVQLLPDETLESLYQRLFPTDAGQTTPVAFALNAAHAHPNDLPVDGDEVAFLPPIGGG